MTALAPAEIVERAEEAYSYFYPIITMDITRLKFTDPTTHALFSGAPNTLVHIREFPPADFRAVVAPNFDTLYSSAWIDLSAGPVIVDVPDSGGRYYLLPFLDMWTDAFAVPGKRTTGTGAQRIVLVPPGWSGDVPEGDSRIDAPTSSLWMIGRTQTNGPSDYDAVHAFQDALAIRSASGAAAVTSLRPSVAPEGLDLTEDPLEIVNTLSATEYFAYGARLLTEYGGHTTDFSILARLSSLGLVAGRPFDPSSYSAEQLVALEEGARAGLALQRATIPRMARVANGWSMNTDTMGVYGNYYLKRAVVTMVGLGANPAEDAVYPIAVADAAGEPIVGEKDYVQHFDADALPPVGAFWSVTMYDKDSFQAPNPLNRFALGDRDPLHYNADGSLDLYYGPTDPGGDRSANWLPAPAGPLRIILRLYAPRTSVLEGLWNPPAITAL